MASFPKCSDRTLHRSLALASFVLLPITITIFLGFVPRLRTEQHAVVSDISHHPTHPLTQAVAAVAAPSLSDGPSKTPSPYQKQTRSKPSFVHPLTQGSRETPSPPISTNLRNNPTQQSRPIPAPTVTSPSTQQSLQYTATETQIPPAPPAHNHRPSEEPNTKLPNRSQSSQSSQQSQPNQPNKSKSRNVYVQKASDWSNFPTKCALIAPADTPPWHSYPFNARSFCLLPKMCVQPAASSVKPGVMYVKQATFPPICAALSPSLENMVGRVANCTTVWTDVLKGNGAFPSHDPEGPLQPQVLPLSSASSSELSVAKWLDGIAIVVPAYPHHHNIFHYAFAIAQTMHLAGALPKLLRGIPVNSEMSKVTLVFRGSLPVSLGLWQHDIVALILEERLKEAGLKSVDVISFNETKRMNADNTGAQKREASKPLICANAALVMGRRADVFQWAFPNALTDISLNGTSAPLESLLFRRAAYKAAGVQSLTSEMANIGEEGTAVTRLFDLPPLAIGYARRNVEVDFGKGETQQGTTRRFSDADEVWFSKMLCDEAKGSNMSFKTIQTPQEMALMEQVHEFASVGILAGVHGANLVNSIFTKPFSALLEVANLQFPCYRGGMNSGLWFESYKPERVGSASESGCGGEPCQSDLNHRRVLISSRNDRAELRRIVRSAIRHVRSLHARFGRLGGIPARYDEGSSEYRIDWRSGT